MIAVEPSLREFQLLVANLWLNRAKNVLALNLAGGDQPGISRLAIEPDHTGLNHIGHREERRKESTVNPAKCSLWNYLSWAIWLLSKSTPKDSNCSRCEGSSFSYGSSAFGN